MIDFLKNFFKTVQESDEASKARWVWILSSFSFIIILVLWGFEVNYRISDLFPEKNKEPGFMETTKQGALVILNKIKTNLDREKIMEVMNEKEVDYSFSPLAVPLPSPKDFPK